MLLDDLIDDDIQDCMDRDEWLGAQLLREIKLLRQESNSNLIDIEEEIKKIAKCNVCLT